MKKVAVSGGAPVTLATVDNPLGAWWGADDKILVAQGAAGILQISGSGGAPTRLIQVKDGEQAQSPERLPGGHWVLFTLRPAGVAEWNQAQIVIQSLTTGERRVLINGGRDARYVPTGHLVYGLNGVLYAVRFDVRSGQVLGGPISLVEGVTDSSNVGGAVNFSVGANGTLVYVGGSLGSAGDRSLVWVDRAGHEEPLKIASQPYFYPRLSPDGTRVAVAIVRNTGSGSDMWVLDLQRGSRTRNTFDGEDNRYYPVWTPDGLRLISSDNNAQKNRIRWAPVTGSGSAETLLEGEERYPASVSPDGHVLAFYQIQVQTGRDLWMLPLEGARKPVSFLATPFEESAPMFSPDGHWLAFASNKSGRNEIYVRPYPAAGAQEYTTSTDGGTEPVWAPSGHELFYRHGNDMMSVAVSIASGSFIAGRPVLLFTGPFALDSSTTQTMANYDVSRDGRRFLMLKSASTSQTAPPVSVVLNWSEELKQRVPTK